MSDEQIPPHDELNHLESALQSLTPARARVDRDRVMFLAGRASAARTVSGRNGWIALAASLALVALGEAAVLIHRPGSQVVERVIVVREPSEKSVMGALASPSVPSPSTEVFPLSNTDHERRMWQVLLYGLDGLPATPSTARTDREVRPGASRKWLREELRKDFDLGDPS